MVNATLADTFCKWGSSGKDTFMHKCANVGHSLPYCIKFTYIVFKSGSQTQKCLCDEFVIYFLVVAVFCAFAFKIRPELFLRKSIWVWKQQTLQLIQKPLKKIAAHCKSPKIQSWAPTIEKVSDNWHTTINCQRSTTDTWQSRVNTR